MDRHNNHTQLLASLSTTHCVSDVWLFLVAHDRHPATLSCDGLWRVEASPEEDWQEHSILV